MDYEKVKEYVEDHSSNFLGSKASLKDLEKFEYVYEKVIEAVEKQISNKVVSTGAKIMSNECPNCHYVWGGSKWNYCHECGQKLDW